jgi:DNA-directed RNA polymerase specialized sigma24 family protein
MIDYTVLTAAAHAGALKATRGNKDAAEDAAQNALLLALEQGLLNYDHIGRLVITAQRQAVMAWRSDTRLVSVDALAQVGWAPEADVDTHAAAERDEARERIASLPPRLRVVVAGRLDGRSYASLAAELGVTPACVRARWYRALKALRGRA